LEKRAFFGIFIQRLLAFLKERLTLAPRTGWLEKWHNGRVLSMVSVQFGKAKLKKTPRKKVFKAQAHSMKDSELYYVLDKRINMGQLSLTGETIFAEKEFYEVMLQVAQFRTHLRLLGKITSVSSFMELKRVLFRAKIQFSAVNKEDFDRLAALAEQVAQEAAARAPAPKVDKNTSREDKPGLKITFKRS
jgi:hypothetical protein